MNKLDSVNKLNVIKKQLKTGQITYEKAQKEAEYYLFDINHRGKKIAKKYGKRHSEITFSYMMR